LWHLPYQEQEKMRRSKEQLRSWGKTALKLAIASTLAAGFTEFLGLEYPFYAAITPIIVMGQTRGTTLQTSLNRIKGTVIGTVIGAAFASSLGNYPWVLLLSVSSSIFLCNYLGLSEASRLAGSISAIVLLNHSVNSWVYAGGRFLETCLGIAAAVFVEEFLWTPRAADNLRKLVSQMLTDSGQVYQLVFDCYITNEYRSKAIADLKIQIVDSIRRSEQLWQEAIGEQHRKLWVDETWEFLLQRLWEHIKTMDYVAETKRADDTFWLGLQPELKNLAEATSVGFNALAEAVRTQNSRPQMPNLDQVLQAATQQLDQLQSHPEAVYSAAELRRFFSFFYSMEEIAKKLKRMSAGL
jgi:uncharacterized membrane protein YccC